MGLKARVGRHGVNGKHCQNHKTDQRVVIALLNNIGEVNGGAGGKLPTREVEGYATAPLCRAIRTFQQRHFPTQVTSFFEPSGPQIDRLILLAGAIALPKAKTSKPSAPAAPAGVAGALKDGLAGDNRLTHSEGVTIIRAALRDGYVTATELSDIAAISATANFESARTKAMLFAFPALLGETNFGAGPYSLGTDRQKRAADLVCDFMERDGAGQFPQLNRDNVGIGLLMRLAKPSLMAQAKSSLCGPTALLYNMASDQPETYARFAVDLFEKGRGTLGSLEITPSSAVRAYAPGDKIAQADWLTMASVRDSENYLLAYSSVERELAGITLPHELANWFRLAGYQRVYDRTTYTPGGGGPKWVEAANELLAQKWRICLFINADMTEGRGLDLDEMAKGITTILNPSSIDDIKKLPGRLKRSFASMAPNHWIVQRSRIEVTNGNVDFTAFTWGKGDFKVPDPSYNDALSLVDFYTSFHGFIAAEP